MLGIGEAVGARARDGTPSEEGITLALLLLSVVLVAGPGIPVVALILLLSLPLLVMMVLPVGFRMPEIGSSGGGPELMSPVFLMALRSLSEMVEVSTSVAIPPPKLLLSMEINLLPAK